MHTIACVVGARPNFVKIAPLLEQFSRNPRFDAILIHTGQHFSREMSDSFFEELEIRTPEVSLGVNGATPIQQMTGIMEKLEELFKTARPDLVLVVGDVTSTVAAALTASSLQIPLAHVEAGLRSFDRSMPEELNRLITDTLSDFLFVSEPSGVRNLRAEGIPSERIHFVGNVMIDTLLKCRSKAGETRAFEKLGVEPKQYVLATLHRPGNVDDPKRLKNLVDVLDGIARTLPVVFPVHPRTRKRMEEIGCAPENIRLAPPQSYLNFLCLMDAARLVMTDSGGIQEETTALGVPCLTMRDNTERPVTIEEGTNQLAGSDPEKISITAHEALARPGQPSRVPRMWDGKTSVRIVEILETVLSGEPIVASR